MIRSLVVIFCCACVAVVLSEAVGVLLLWQQGLLTDHHLKEIRLVFTNAEPMDTADREEERAAPAASLQEVTQARAVRIFELEKRESELGLLKSMANTEKENLNSQLAAFRTLRKNFETELAQLEASLSSAATEQSRGILLAMAPKDAVAKLMELSVDNGVRLLKGMPEKSIAKILKEFSETPEQLERGKKIFEAISRGEPTKKFLEEAKKQFGSETTAAQP